MRLIDADALLKHEIEADRMGAMLVVGKGYILSAPEVDAVPVVRCCECKYYENPRLKVFEKCCRKDLLIPMKPNDYCSYGIKMEEAT